MKKIMLFMAVIAAFALTSCKKDPQVEDKGELEIKSLEITGAAVIDVPGQVSFTAAIADPGVRLSTLEVAAMLDNGDIVATKSIITKGNEATVSETIDIPFAPFMEEGAPLHMSFEAINVEGKSVKQVKDITIQRPALPDVLYMTIDGEVFEMYRNSEIPDVYTTDVAGGFENIVSATIADNETLSQANVIWGKSSVDNEGEVCSLSEASGIQISYPAYLVENYSFNVLTFSVSPVGQILSIAVGGTALVPTNGLLYASIDFTQGAEVAITGIEDIDNAYNRDFFSYEGGKFTFLRESGTYDVFYSPKYNYIWIAKMDAVGPECLWVVGHGFTCAPVWHEDFSDGGWEVEDITRMGYAVKVADNKYQCSMYLNDQHAWGSFEFEVYSNAVEWTKDYGFGGKTISGFNKGVKLSAAADGMPGLLSDTGFQPGYYTITFDNATGDINLDRKTEWVDSGKSGVIIAGVDLDVAEGYDYATIDFTKGASVDFSGIDAVAMNRDFFEISGSSAKFIAPTGSYLVQYYPEYNYVWLTPQNAADLDFIYILGSGKMSCPVYDDSDASALWTDVAYTRSAPFFSVAPKIADNTYQATMSMSTSNFNWRVLVEFYSDLSWGQDAAILPASISGPAADRFYMEPYATGGNYIIGKDEVGDAFVPGNYKFTITTSGSGANVEITKID